MSERHPRTRLGAVLRRVDSWIADRPRRTVVAFLLVTAGLATGFGGISTETGTEQFTTGVPEEAALEEVNRQFSPPFEPDTGSTQLLQSGVNVLGKSSLSRMLRLQERLLERPSLRVAATTSVARLVARELDPDAATIHQERLALERASASQIQAAVSRLAATPGFAGLLSKDFTPRSGTASATIALIDHDLPADLEGGAGQGGSSPLTPIQRRVQRLVGTVGGDITVFGVGIIAAEFGQVVGDSLLIVVPAAVVLILLFLIVAYRDPIDLLLGTIALAMTIVWTFGFMGLAGIPFGQFLIAVPPLLLAVGIDFGIHAINRYREERAAGSGTREGMRLTTHQLLVAFGIVTGTTVVGFLANLSSQLTPIRDFGLVASVGILFTFCVFGVFLPALKVWTDLLRERTSIPRGIQTPLGGEGSRLGRVLTVGAVGARRAPWVVLALAVVVGTGAGVAATDIDTGFSEEDFLPPENPPAFLSELPEPFRPSEYTITATTNFLERNFEAAEDDRVTVYIEGPMERDTALESMVRAARDPPETVVVTSGASGRIAERQSIVTVIRSVAERDPSFARLVAERDTNANGVPDENLEAVYDALLASPARDVALEYLSEDRRSARVEFTVEADADPAAVTADARVLADRYRTEAIPTGSIVVFQAIAGLIFESAVVSLALALVGTVAFLLVVYTLLADRPTLALVNALPIVLTVALLAGTMVALGIAFNAFTATVLAITIGLGIDYSVHVIHRYVDERRRYEPRAALSRTVQGTGGALTGSVLTTAGGIGVLVLAVFPAIGQFGLLTAVSVLYSYLASVLVLPSVLVIWERYRGFDQPTDPHRLERP